MGDGPLRGRAEPLNLALAGDLVTCYERAEGQLVPSKMGTSLDYTLVMTVSAARAPDLYERVIADGRFAVLTPLAVPITVPAAS